MDAIAAITDRPLDHGSDEPLYLQLERRILQVIATGGLDEKTPLPTEQQLCDALDVSRTTVRRCYQDLTETGSVTRRRREGTFVSPSSTRQNLGMLLNFSAEMTREGKEPSSKLMGLRKRTSSKGISRRLQVPDGTEVWEIKRLRLGNGIPMRLETAFVPCSLCPTLSERDLRKSLYARITEESGALPARAEEAYEAVCLDKKEADALDEKPGSPAFRVLRTSYDTLKRPFETSVLVEPADRNHLLVTLDTEGIELRKYYGLS
ncbi:MAG: GntR family transcriptional regulator [Atopobiaceae bacterium]|jgi:GntR family transcriptional regulator|nr:GntR family transcriptional regulator [Atopobiaceae bacterium]MCI2206894.1 GntR family transcriptional regulator [Atopobiaceae bacterium]